MSAIRGRNQASGSHGKFWFNNKLVLETEAYEAKVIANREDTQFGMDIDSKLTGLKGEGTYRVKKVFSMGKKEILEAWKKGEDPRCTFMSKIEDPDTPGKQVERVSIDNVWLNELILQQFETGQPLTEEYSFGFTPSDADFLDVIE